MLTEAEAPNTRYTHTAHLLAVAMVVVVMMVRMKVRGF
jgi:hypothetical protein